MSPQPLSQQPTSRPSSPTLLAFDTSTEHLFVALGVGDAVHLHEAAGGAQASAALIPAIRALLARAELRLADLDAIGFGRGPGAFTGLRTACAVAQGLAFGGGLPVLPIDTLLAVAQDACAGSLDAEPGRPQQCWVAMDARMNEIYAAEYLHVDGRWQTLTAPALIGPQALEALWRVAPPTLVAGNALTAFAETLDTGAARRIPHALPRAAALLPLARAHWAAGQAVDAACALPLYLRDKVAQTTLERDAARAAKAALASG